MPYGLILLVAVLGLSARFVLAADASARHKALVAVVCIASVALAYLVPSWHLAGMLGQACLVSALVFHSKATGART
jgi:hypothetical protein